MILGKVIAGAIGFIAGGIGGLLVGLVVGHFFDRGLGRTLRFASPENLRRVQQRFFDTTFLLSGFLAKADGRISEQEVAHTEQLFVQLGLNAEQRRNAIALFKRGAEPGFDPATATADFVRDTGNQRQLRQALLLFLISLAHADAGLEPAEHAALVRIASGLGVGAAELEGLVRMAQAQGHFHKGGAGAASSSGPSVDDAYAALGVSSDVNDRDLKRAYRKRMSENHPDKLIAQGVPEEMVKLATERSQEIQAAYDVVRRQRGLAR